MARILIKNGRVWDGEKFFFADVLTDGVLIGKIAKNITDTADFTYDATGKTVCAGLVDIHVHMKGIAPGKFGVEPHISSNLNSCGSAWQGKRMGLSERGQKCRHCSI